MPSSLQLTDWLQRHGFFPKERIFDAETLLSALPMLYERSKKLKASEEQNWVAGFFVMNALQMIWQDFETLSLVHRKLTGLMVSIPFAPTATKMARNMMALSRESKSNDHEPLFSDRNFEREALKIIHFWRTVDSAVHRYLLPESMGPTVKHNWASIGLTRADFNTLAFQAADQLAEYDARPAEQRGWPTFKFDAQSKSLSHRGSQIGQRLNEWMVSKTQQTRYLILNRLIGLTPKEVLNYCPQNLEADSLESSVKKQSTVLMGTLAQL